MLNADAAGVVLALDPVLGCGQGLLSDGSGKSEIIFTPAIRCIEAGLLP
jgi:hypothetical protein